MNRCVVLSLVLLVACDSGKKEAAPTDLRGIEDEASVDFARKQLPELDAKLASSDPGAASSICSVVKPDLPAIRKADAKLAGELERRCGRDLALRSLTVFVERAEAARKADPGARFLPECSSWDIYMKPVKAAGADGAPEIAKLKERHAAACPGT